jgi:hypothetical protein
VAAKFPAGARRVSVSARLHLLQRRDKRGGNCDKTIGLQRGG